MINTILMTYKTDLVVHCLALLLFFGNLFLDYYACFAGGTNKSPIIGSLLENGNGWAFGISSGLTLMIAEVSAFLLLNLMFDWTYPCTFILLAEAVILYITVVIGLNIWSKWFLNSKGFSVNDNVGWKWFVKKYKENLTIEKEKMSKHKNALDEAGENKG